MSGSEHARPVWLTEDDGIALGYILRGSPGNADLAKWAESMLARRDAAPADPAEAIRQAIGECFSPRERSSVVAQAEISFETEAVLRALGHPKEPA